MELWVYITVAAAFLQNLRSAMQKRLTGRLSTAGATFVRFGFGFPFAIVYVFALHHVFGMDWPVLHIRFALFGAAGGLAQILGTFLLLHLLSYRNFVVGTAYSKTDIVQAALFGIVILGDQIGLGAAIAISVAMTGVISISAARTEVTVRSLILSFTERRALIGLASGAMFGISAVFYRAASLSLGGPGFLIPAGFTLVCVSIFQTLVMLGYMRLREPGQITDVMKSWRPSLAVGMSGIAGSACWFTAMTIQNVAYVRALGQIELIFTFIASYFFFHERSNRREVAGVILVAGGILILLLAG